MVWAFNQHNAGAARMNHCLLTPVDTLRDAVELNYLAAFVASREAVKVMKKFQADIVLTDWHMEPQDGIDLVRIIRNSKDSPNPYVPIIMLTGHTELQRVIDARDAGVNEFLAKPLSAKSLYGRIATIIESPRPFVRTKEYFGPCRRRQNLGPQGGMKERRHDELAKMAEAEGLSPEEFEELMLLQSPD